MVWRLEFAVFSRAGVLAKQLNPCQSPPAKIFHFTEIRICRMCRPSQPTKGAVVRRHERGLGVAVDAGGVKGGLVRAGRDEPREHGTNRIDGRRSNLAKSLAKQEACVRRNRVVLTVVATVKPLRRRQRVNRRGAVHFAEVTEARRNSSPGSNCVEVARRSAGLKAGACAPPPPAADGLDPARSPVFRLCMRSAEAERSRLLGTGWGPISHHARS
ncbi:hypothetical protein Bra471DRAFT_06539 [Bradyrhizobium sp. WSM471]|nr:hypothetical protein Bra471DRAFT_06539 [Bradyrhizobium sp. WSM471]